MLVVMGGGKVKYGKYMTYLSIRGAFLLSQNSHVLALLAGTIPKASLAMLNNDREKCKPKDTVGGTPSKLFIRHYY